MRRNDKAYIRVNENGKRELKHPSGEKRYELKYITDVYNQLNKELEVNSKLREKMRRGIYGEFGSLTFIKQDIIDTNNIQRDRVNNLFTIFNDTINLLEPNEYIHLKNNL